MLIIVHLLIFFIASNTVSDGRTVRALLGRHVSFSFMLTTSDAITFYHGTSRFLTVWTDATSHLAESKLKKIEVAVNVSAHGTIIVTINLLNISADDGGIYTAKKQFTSEEFNDSVKLQLIDESVLPRIDVVRHFTLNSSLLLQCKLYNMSDISTNNILWKLNASLIETEERFSISDDLLSICNLTAGDQYNVYTCMEQGNELESDPYIMQTSDPTIIKFTPNITAVFEHESLNISCNSKCGPICNWQWTKIDATSGQERVVSGENILRIQNFTKQDAGKYSCKVQNILTGTALVGHISMDVISSPSKIQLMYLFLGFGIGVLLAFVIFSCLQKMCQKRVGNKITFQARVEEVLPVENPVENYWTIVSNEGGTLSTALESNANHMSQSASIYNKDTSTVNQLDISEFMIKEDEMECDGYIHPIHTSPMNTGVSSRRHTTSV
ncbi:hypothetical protein ACJMK2_026994 [Sinanodonta woodiana]|uniref:Ig-like domain-containing protein n=1 Tax=Sinanodonta woodiana TaxID=1069815 RepID=A0ABD3XPX8_SINWO